MKKYCFFLSVFALMLTCKKPDKIIDETPVSKVTYTVDSSSTQPGVFLIIKSSSPIKRDTATILLSGKQSLFCKIDSFHYAFIVPVVDPGKYTLDLTIIDGANSPEITVKNYNTITNPEVTINTIINDCHKLVDSIKKNSFPNSVTPTDIAFMHQIINQTSDNINALSIEQKLLAAYQLQQLNFDKISFHQFNVDTMYMAKIQESEDEPAQQLFENSLLNLLKKEGAMTTLWLVKASGMACLIIPSIHMLVAFESSFTLYLVLRAIAKSSSTQLDNVTAIADDNLLVEDEANPVEFIGKQGVWQKLKGLFRNIQPSDKGGASTTISDVINSDEELQTEDSKVKEIFDKARNVARNFFDNINLPYDLYISPLVLQAKEKIAPIKNQFISITAVSNPNIQLTASDDGPNGLRISATNPSNNITTPTDFTFELTYTQEAINNKVSITQNATFTPASEDSILSGTYAGYRRYVIYNNGSADSVQTNFSISFDRHEGSNVWGYITSGYAAPFAYSGTISGSKVSLTAFLKDYLVLGRDVTTIIEGLLSADKLSISGMIIDKVKRSDGIDEPDQYNPFVIVKQ